MEDVLLEHYGGCVTPYYTILQQNARSLFMSVPPHIIMNAIQIDVYEEGGGGGGGKGVFAPPYLIFILLFKPNEFSLCGPL